MEQMLRNRRRYLTEDELEKLIKAGRKGRYGSRDATLMLVMARHGLRVTEAVDLRWDQVDFTKGHLHIKRLKGGIRGCPATLREGWMQEQMLRTAVPD